MLPPPAEQKFSIDSEELSNILSQNRDGSISVQDMKILQYMEMVGSTVEPLHANQIAGILNRASRNNGNISRSDFLVGFRILKRYADFLIITEVFKRNEFTLESLRWAAIEGYAEEMAKTFRSRKSDGNIFFADKVTI